MEGTKEMSKRDEALCREPVLERFAAGGSDEGIADRFGVGIRVVQRIIQKATESPASYYEVLLLAGGNAARRRLYAPIAALGRMSRRRKAAAIRRLEWERRTARATQEETA